MANATAAHAAAQIVALINGRPQSPRVEEIEAIIRSVAPHGTAPVSEDASALTQWRVLRAKETAAWDAVTKLSDAGAGDDRIEEAQELAGEEGRVLNDFAREVWAKPASTPFDVFLRAEIALYHENGIMEELENVKAYYDERSFAQLIEAAVTIGRRVYG